MLIKLKKIKKINSHQLKSVSYVNDNLLNKPWVQMLDQQKEQVELNVFQQYLISIMNHMSQLNWQENQKIPEKIKKSFKC